MADYTLHPTDTPGRRQAFLALPGRLYGKRRLTQNPAEEKALLAGSHILSGDFRFEGYVLYRDGVCVARCALTLYPGSQTGYLGFFECENDAGAAALLFREAERQARQAGCNALVGPVNASFWLGYRMKTDGFDQPPYFSEPYNPAWYPPLWAQNGYEVSDRYLSNLYHRVPLLGQKQGGQKYRERYRDFRRQGYVIRSPKPREFDEAMRQVYRMLMPLYRDFPVFTPLSEEQFCRHYAGLRHTLAYSLTKIAYKDSAPVGFFISVPDYGNRLADPGPGILPWVLAKRIRSRRYVLLYMGVLPEHRGLGKALAQTVLRRAWLLRADAIGAFIHTGKETERYGEHLLEGRRHYCLYRKELT